MRREWLPRNQFDENLEESVFFVKRTVVKTPSLLPESEEIERLPPKTARETFEKTLFLLSVPLGKLPFLSVFAFPERISAKFSSNRQHLFQSPKIDCKIVMQMSIGRNER